MEEQLPGVGGSVEIEPIAERVRIVVVAREHPACRPGICAVARPGAELKVVLAPANEHAILVSLLLYSISELRQGLQSTRCEAGMEAG